MSDLVRKFPNSLIGRKTALMRLQLYCNGIPPAMLMLPQDVKDYFAQPDLPFLSAGKRSYYVGQFGTQKPRARNPKNLYH